MGTNYYFHEKEPCGCCGREYEPLHIGKSSGGWHFSLHVIPEDGLKSLEDWRNRWAAGGRILDEYGDSVSVEQMLDIITNRFWHHNKDWSICGYSSEQEFHRRNGSERGLNGLVRHKKGVFCCVENGEGTWDYIKGDFS